MDTKRATVALGMPYNSQSLGGALSIRGGPAATAGARVRRVSLSVIVVYQKIIEVSLLLDETTEERDVAEMPL